MKIAVSAQSHDLDSAIDPRFGRAAGFIILDMDTGESSYLKNDQNMALAQGAGIQAAQTVAEAGVGAVITGHVGPKAFMALSKGKISVHLAPSEVNIAKAISLYKAGKLPATLESDKAGHW